MKVTFCAHDVANYISGPNTWLRRLLPDLKKQGVDVNVLFITHSEPALCPTVTALQNQGISCKIQSEYKYTEQHVQWILGSLRENPPDVFVSNLMVPAYYAARWAREAGIPTVGVMHSDDKFYYGLLDEFVCGNPEYRLSALVCVSEYLNHQVLLRKPEDMIIRKIPYGAPIPRSSAYAPDGPLRLIYTGRLKDQQKRISEVTRTLCRTVKEIPGTEAYIYGEGPEQPAVESILLNEGKTLPVYLKGLVDCDEIQQHMLSGHIFVLLSDYEGLPISLMEAMACSLVPVCLKMSSGIPELINDGTNGLLVSDRGNSFINAVRKLREDKSLWERLSKAACDKIKDGYTHENCVKLWITLLDDLNSQKNGRKMIHTPNRIELPPSHQGLAHEDKRTPTGFVLLSIRIKHILDFAKRILKKLFYPIKTFFDTLF
jgi:colanic acid/amylovoran biosynthesis glycosyltransferase